VPHNRNHTPSDLTNPTHIEASLCQGDAFWRVCWNRFGCGCGCVDLVVGPGSDLSEGSADWMQAGHAASAKPSLRSMHNDRETTARPERATPATSSHNRAYLPDMGGQRSLLCGDAWGPLVTSLGGIGIGLGSTLGAIGVFGRRVDRAPLEVAQQRRRVGPKRTHSPS
jgi:hypothetical protein